MTRSGDYAQLLKALCITELTDQFSHLKEQALGMVGALTQPFTDLSSIPTEFIGEGLSWKNDFTAWPGSWPERWRS